MTDPIADMLTRIRNACLIKKQEIILPFSKVKYSILEILKQQNYIKNYSKIENNFTEIDIHNCKKLTIRYLIIPI